MALAIKRSPSAEKGKTSSASDATKEGPMMKREGSTITYGFKRVKSNLEMKGEEDCREKDLEKGIKKRSRRWGSREGSKEEKSKRRKREQGRRNCWREFRNKLR